jgi:lysophospholipase L1-like esterase
MLPPPILTDPPVESAHLKRTRRAGLLAAALCAALSAHSLAFAAEPVLRCGPFTAEAAPPAVPREAASAVRSFERIKAAVRGEPHQVLFLGDSLTERFDPLVWSEHMAPRGVLNAGVTGDRSENLLWRLKHGNLHGPPPAAIVVLIGTNDLTYAGGRSPELAAEGIRANLVYLRRRLPDARILLLGLLPRGGSPDGALRLKTVRVNELIRHCGDSGAVVYQDVGRVLLDSEGRLPPEIAPDRLHLSQLGYTRLVQRLGPLIDALAGAR